MSNQTTSNVNEISEQIRLEYCAELRKKSGLIESLVGKVVGRVSVSKPQEYRDAGYECAAWWEERISGTGVYDIVIRQDPHSKDRLYLAANLPATVKADYFQSLFCGNSIGSAYDSSKNAGKPCRDIVIVRNDLAQAVSDASKSYDDEDGTKWAILPEFWQAISDYHQAMLQNFMSYYKLASYDYQNKKDDQYASKLGQVGYAAESISKHARAVQTVNRKIESRNEEVSRGSTDYFTQNNAFAFLS